MDSDSNEVTKLNAKNIEKQSSGPSNNHLTYAQDSSLDLNNLNLNSSILVEGMEFKMPVSCSSSSIALLNAKTKALQNMKRIDAFYSDEYDKMNMALQSTNHMVQNNSNLSSTNSKNETSQENLAKRNHFMNEFDTQLYSYNHNSQDNEKSNFHSYLNLPFDSSPSKPLEDTDNQKNTDQLSKFMPTSSDNIVQIEKSTKSIRRSDTEIIETNNEEILSRNPITSKKFKAKGYALFGRKNKHSTAQFYYNNQMSIRSSAKSKTVSKKINNKIDWSDNSKLGMHIWSDHSNPNNHSCYMNELDVLKFHNINSQGRCLNNSKNIPKKKCNICKIIVHESCVESLQQKIKCRSTYRENISKKKSFRDKEHLVANSTISSNPNSHHWICYKFDENSFENKCHSCQKSYTNRFGLQTNRIIVSCSWCKQTHHMKCLEGKTDFRKEECSFGELKQLIVPPSWIVKLSNKSSVRSNFLLKSHSRSSNIASNVNNSENHSQLLPSNILKSQSSLRHSNKAFIIRPPSISSNPNISMTKPLLVLINPKSGGKMGQKLLNKFTWLLNARQVFDLSLNPKFPLHLYRNVPNLKILVGGGDGSVGWVLSTIDQIKFLGEPPSVAVLPLGTGNDLARTLHWGGAYNDEPLSKMMKKILESRIVKLDRWKITVVPNKNVDIDPSEKDESTVDSLKNDVINNYFSLGIDAHIALDFHHKREANPQKFTSRWLNFLQYFDSFKGNVMKKTWSDLKDFIDLECDNISYTEMIKQKGYHFILFQNIPKYSAGTNPWGCNQNDSHFQPQSMNDGRIEVVGCYTSHLAKIHIGLDGDRICQAKRIKLVTSTYIPIQIDGEPNRLSPSIIEIKHKNQASMLEHVKNNTDSPLLSYHSNIIKNFEVKCILKSDYKLLRKETKQLESLAISIGTICTSNLLDTLSKVRNTINVLLKNCASGFNCTRWTFLNAEEFYRINDDSGESLLDIVSADEIIYILDESSEESNLSEMNMTDMNENEMSENFDLIKNDFQIQKQQRLSEILETSSSVNETLFKIPISQTSHQISNKQTIGLMPSSKSTQFNLKVPSYV